MEILIGLNSFPKSIYFHMIIGIGCLYKTFEVVATKLTFQNRYKLRRILVRYAFEAGSL